MRAGSVSCLNETLFRSLSVSHFCLALDNETTGAYLSDPSQSRPSINRSSINRYPNLVVGSSFLPNIYLSLALSHY